jgi:hypothetical protein
VRESRFASRGNLTFSLTEIAALLQLCTQNAKDEEAQWVPLLEATQNDTRQEQYRDPKVIIIEFIWPLWHLPSPEDIQEKDVTGYVNTTLLTRGEVRQYEPQEIGDRLKNDLRLTVTRFGPGMFLIFDRANLRVLHRWAKIFGTVDAVEGCPDCIEAQIPKSQSV